MSLRFVVALTGASGAPYGIRLLEALAERKIETHLIMTKTAKEIVRLETNRTQDDVRRLASHFHNSQDLKAPISSGSFRHDGMVIVPCSMKTLAAVAHGFADNLVTRAADVTLKEHRKLILVPRETPLNSIHLANMLSLSQLGVVMIPPIPAFYSHPKTLEDIINQCVGRILDCIGLEHDLYGRWNQDQMPEQGVRASDRGVAGEIT